MNATEEKVYRFVWKSEDKFAEFHTFTELSVSLCVVNIRGAGSTQAFVFLNTFGCNHTAGLDLPFPNVFYFLSEICGGFFCVVVDTTN